MLKTTNSIISASRITGVLPVVNGGTGVTTSTGTGNTVLSASPTFSGTAVFAALSGGASGTGYSFSGTAPATSLALDSSGNLGIGTSSPTQKLDVVATSSATSIIVAQNTTASDGGGQIRAGNPQNIIIVGGDSNGGSLTGVANSSFIYTNSTTPLLFLLNGVEKMRIASSGIVTMSAYGAGAATFSAAGVISSVSDETWKVKDGVPTDPDAMLKKLEPGYWYYNDEKKETFGADRQLGFYAQNVNAAIGPEAAPTPEEGKPWGYHDRSVLAITVMSLQKALATIEELNNRITVLESKCL